MVRFLQKSKHVHFNKLDYFLEKRIRKPRNMKANDHFSLHRKNSVNSTQFQLTVVQSVWCENKGRENTKWSQRQRHTATHINGASNCESQSYNRQILNSLSHRSNECCCPANCVHIEANNISSCVFSMDVDEIRSFETEIGTNTFEAETESGTETETKTIKNWPRDVSRLWYSRLFAGYATYNSLAVCTSSFKLGFSRRVQCQRLTLL